MTDTIPLHSVRTLLVPGIGNSGPQHWQSLWEARYSFCTRVQQRDWDHPVASEWQAQLEAAAAEAGPDVLIAAHSLGCLLVAQWAMTTASRIGGVLFVAVPDPTTDVFPKAASGFSQVPRSRIRFPTILIASTNDPYSEVSFARVCAAAWGSRFIDIGPAGHINAASGLGAWPFGFNLLQELRG